MSLHVLNPILELRNGRQRVVEFLESSGEIRGKCDVLQGAQARNRDVGDVNVREKGHIVVCLDEALNGTVEGAEIVLDTGPNGVEGA